MRGKLVANMCMCVCVCLKLTSVGFEPTPMKTTALTSRLRPLGHDVAFLTIFHNTQYYNPHRTYNNYASLNTKHTYLLNIYTITINIYIYYLQKKTMFIFGAIYVVLSMRSVVPLASSLRRPVLANIVSTRKYCRRPARWTAHSRLPSH